MEMDETGVRPDYEAIGGSSPKPKTTVFGMVERQGRVRAMVAQDRKTDTLDTDVQPVCSARKLGFHRRFSFLRWA